MREKKRGFLCLAALLLLLPVCTLADYGIIHGGRLNMRERPDYEARVIASYPTGTWVEILDGSGPFYRVMDEQGRTGYMASGYLTVDDGRLGTWGTVENGRKYVNLRTGPATNYAVIARYGTGTRVEILDYGNIFAKVRVDRNTIGYMSNGLIRLDGQQVWEENVIRSNVHLRVGPSKRADVIRTVRKGTKVITLIDGLDWCKVVVDGEVGYMASAYVRPQEDEKDVGPAIGAGARWTGADPAIGSGANPTETGPAIDTGASASGIGSGVSVAP